MKFTKEDTQWRSKGFVNCEEEVGLRGREVFWVDEIMHSPSILDNSNGSAAAVLPSN